MRGQWPQATLQIPLQENAPSNPVKPSESWSKLLEGTVTLPHSRSPQGESCHIKEKLLLPIPLLQWEVMPEALPPHDPPPPPFICSHATIDLKRSVIPTLLGRWVTPCSRMAEFKRANTTGFGGRRRSCWGATTAAAATAIAAGAVAAVVIVSTAAIAAGAVTAAIIAVAAVTAAVVATATITAAASIAAAAAAAADGVETLLLIGCPGFKASYHRPADVRAEEGVGGLQEADRKDADTADLPELLKQLRGRGRGRGEREERGGGEGQDVHE